MLLEEENLVSSQFHLAGEAATNVSSSPVCFSSHMWHCFAVLTAKLQLELAQKWPEVRLVTPGETCWANVKSLSFPSGTENEVHPADAKTCPLLSTEFCNPFLTG